MVPCGFNLGLGRLVKRIEQFLSQSRPVYRRQGLGSCEQFFDQRRHVDPPRRVPQDYRRGCHHAARVTANEAMREMVHQGSITRSRRDLSVTLAQLHFDGLAVVSCAMTCSEKMARIPSDKRKGVTGFRP